MGNAWWFLVYDYEHPRRNHGAWCRSDDSGASYKSNLVRYPIHREVVAWILWNSKLEL